MIQKLNSFFQTKTPFIVISNFDGTKLEVYSLQEAKEAGIFFSINHNKPYTKHTLTLQKEPVTFEHYKERFEKVLEHIKAGNTYLLNLTQPTKIQTKASLQEIYEKTNATYKIKYKDQFVCFSPESFVQVSKDGKIATYPMKGTIDATLPNALQQILNNQKEMAEHVMVVDLLRNDLGIIASHVKVERFRYPITVQTNTKTLLQISSKITAKLAQNWQEEFATKFTQLLPAGSITGTPKKKTTQLIKEIEGYERGFFTGVFGYFDGKSFDSCVMIRFIEKTPQGLVYKSGGGITLESDALAEYNELLDKVYLP